MKICMITKQKADESDSFLAQGGICMLRGEEDYESYFEERFVAGLSIRKYAQAHSLNRGSVDYLQKKFFTTLAHELKERDEAQGKKRIRTT